MQIYAHLYIRQLLRIRFLEREIEEKGTWKAEKRENVKYKFQMKFKYL